MIYSIEAIRIDNGWTIKIVRDPMDAVVYCSSSAVVRHVIDKALTGGPREDIWDDESRWAQEGEKLEEQADRMDKVTRDNRILGHAKDDAQEISRSRSEEIEHAKKERDEWCEKAKMFESGAKRADGRVRQLKEEVNSLQTSMFDQNADNDKKIRGLQLMVEKERTDHADTRKHLLGFLDTLDLATRDFRHTATSASSRIWKCFQQHRDYAEELSVGCVAVEPEALAAEEKAKIQKLQQFVARVAVVGETGTWQDVVAVLDYARGSRAQIINQDWS